MKENQQPCRSRSTSKGFVFSLDAALAIVIFISLVLVPSYYFFQGTKGFVSNIEVNRVLNDTAKVLDQKNSLQTLSREMIEADIRYLVPENYKYKVDLQCYEYMGAFVESDFIEIDKNSSALVQKVHGKYFFLVYTSGPQKEIDKYCIMSWEAGI